MKIAIRNILCIASMVFAVTAWGQSVSVGSAVGAPGTTGVVIPVNLTAGRDIAGIDMNVTFTTAAQYSAIAVDCGVATVSTTLFDSCSVSGNVVTVQIADTGGNAWVDGLLANITVDVDGSATPMVDPLVAVVVGAGDTTGTDLDPLPTSSDGTFEVPAGPQPVFMGTPTGLAMSSKQGLANPTGSVTVTNTGETSSLLSGTCTLAGDMQITMSNGGFTDIAVGAAGSVVGVACDASAAVSSYAATLSCDHNGSNAKPVDFAVTCDILASASDLLPQDGSLSIVVPINGTGQTSVSFEEILDEGVDATVDACTFGNPAVFTVVTALPVTVAAGTTEIIIVEGTDPFDGSLTVEDTLTCTYTDSDSTPGTASWPVTLIIQSAAIPTLSSWGLMLMILTMLGLGGIIIRRKTFS